MRAGGTTTNPNFAVNLPKGMGGSNPSGLLFPNSVGNSDLADMKTMQSNQAWGQGATMAIQAVGQIATAAIGHAMKMSALKHQESMQNKAWAASVQAIKDEGHLVDDINLINKNKIRLGHKFVRAQKDSTIADARLLEAKKTEKAMKKANKTLVKKALTDRRRRFYGKTA